MTLMAMNNSQPRELTAMTLRAAADTFVWGSDNEFP
jgi:hypothetical protein